MPGSRLLPPEQRATLPTAPATSTWWRVQVLLRSALNRHRRRWLAPLLVCAPPVGVAMVWAGATRPGHQRRWLTAAGATWTLCLLVGVVLLTTSGVTRAGADPSASGPGARPGVAALVPSSPSSSAAAAPSPVVAASSAPVAVVTPPSTSVAEAAEAPAAAPAAPVTTAAAPVPAAAPTAAATAAATTPRSAPAPSQVAPAPTTKASAPPPAKPTPPKPGPPPVAPPAPPHPAALPTVMPLTACQVEGAAARSPHGFALHCGPTPIGLLWLWGQ